MARLMSVPALRTVWGLGRDESAGARARVKRSRGSLDARMGADVGHVALHVSHAVEIAEGAI